MIRISAWTTFKGKLYKSLNLLIYGSLCLIDTIIFFKIIIINDVATKTNQLRETYNPCKPLMTRKKTMGPPKPYAQRNGQYILIAMNMRE